jgi:hypothetical protein
VRLLQDVSCTDAYWSDLDEHLPPLDRDIEVAAVDEAGVPRRVRIEVSRSRARHHMNRRDPERDRIYEQVTLFCPAADVESGRRGWAGVEVGKLLERPGVCDEAIPGRAPPPGSAAA